MCVGIRMKEKRRVGYMHGGEKTKKEKRKKKMKIEGRRVGTCVKEKKLREKRKKERKRKNKKLLSWAKFI